MIFFPHDNFPVTLFLGQVGVLLLLLLLSLPGGGFVASLCMAVPSDLVLAAGVVSS